MPQPLDPRRTVFIDYNEMRGNIAWTLDRHTPLAYLYEGATVMCQDEDDQVFRAHVLEVKDNGLVKIEVDLEHPLNENSVMQIAAIDEYLDNLQPPDLKHMIVLGPDGKAYRDGQELP